METKITKGKLYVSDIEQDDGYYIYSDLNSFEAIARIYRKNRPNAREDAENFVNAVNNQYALQKENDQLNKYIDGLLETGSSKLSIKQISELTKQRDELLLMLQKIHKIDNRAFSLKNFDVIRLKNEIGAAIDNATKL